MKNYTKDITTIKQAGGFPTYPAREANAPGFPTSTAREANAPGFPIYTAREAYAPTVQTRTVE